MYGVGRESLNLELEEKDCKCVVLLNVNIYDN
jgi:hypothetical protein